MTFGSRHLFVCLGLVLLASPAWCGWRQQLLDPPDFRADLSTFTDGLTYEQTDEFRAKVVAYVIGGIVLSTSADALAEETTKRRHVWDPEPDCPTGRFSWAGHARIVGRFRVSPPATSAGNGLAHAECYGFGMASVSDSGSSATTSGPGATAGITSPGGGGSVGFPTSGMGGGGGLGKLQTTNGDTKCVLEATTVKIKYAYVTSWADSRWIPPQVGSADGEVEAECLPEEHELGGCCE